jgi:putative tryptophan/tyrosine transport system substrate-binding protein
VIRRRDFITLLGGAATWPVVARAQQLTMPQIGFLSTASADGIAPFVDAFRQGLSAGGFTEGKTIAIEYRWAGNQHDQLPALAADLVARRVAVIVTASATAAALAAKAATSTIPIVFALGSDPVKFGLVNSMNRPGGNVTGVSYLGNLVVAKQLQLLKGLLPAAGLIGVMVNPENPNAASDAAQAQVAAAALGLQVHTINVAAARDIDAAFGSLAEARCAALLVAPDTLFIDERRRLAEITADRKLPAIYSNRLYIEDGGLMSYGSSPVAAFREAGIYTGRILRGESPAVLPVVQSVKFDLVINLKAAKALGLEVPPMLLALADEVIE